MTNRSLLNFKNLEQIPNDALFEILLNAEPTEINRLCRLNRKFATLCQNDELWRRKYIHKYGNIKPEKRFLIPGNRNI